MLQCKNIMKDYVSGDEIVHALKGVSLSFVNMNLFQYLDRVDVVRLHF